MDLPVAFYFKVKIGNIEIPFKEVSGLSAEMEVDTYQEGGVNDYQHRLPKQVKQSNLVLKRALQPFYAQEVRWIKSVLGGGGAIYPIQPSTIHISLLNAKGIPIYTWACFGAFPVKWDIDPLDAEKNSVLIESLEFAYKNIVRV